MHDISHDEAERLLPWYETGQLSALEEAQMRRHLQDCSSCQAELEQEKRLREALCGSAADYGRTPAMDWLAFKGRLAEDRTGPEVEPLRSHIAKPVPQNRVPGATWFKWAFAAQFVVVAIGLAAIVHMQMKAHDPAPYRTLGAAASTPKGNVVVVFQPQTSEAVFRQILQDNQARMIDGPTEANGYILRVPAAQRDQIVKNLQHSKNITLAEPIDASDVSQ